MNRWDVQPTLDWRLLQSSGRIARNRLIATPGPDPASPAAHPRASPVQAVQPVVVSTAACDGRPGGGPAHEGVHQLPRPHAESARRSAVTPTIDIKTTRCGKRRAPSTSNDRANHEGPSIKAAGGSVKSLETGSESTLGNSLVLKADSSLIGSVGAWERRGFF